MAHIRGFPPIARPDARTLILGSMPSRESLARSQYYAHPRNAFWPIVCELLGITETDYQKRTALAVDNGYAIWDVLKACFRSSSLDSDIDDSTIVTNDFNVFFHEHSAITRVFFNGAKSESVYRKHVLPRLEETHAGIIYQRLPSTSPANAAMSRDQKLNAWQVIVL